MLLNIYGNIPIENDAQRAYRLALGLQDDSGNPPGTAPNIISNPEVRRKVNKRIREDDLTWVNACSQNANHHPSIVAHTCFDYTRVYSLY